MSLSKLSDDDDDDETREHVCVCVCVCVCVIDMLIPLSRLHEFIDSPTSDQHPHPVHQSQKQMTSLPSNDWLDAQPLLGKRCGDGIAYATSHTQLYSH